MPRSLADGSWRVVRPENFRYSFGDERQARDYIRSAGLIDDPETFAIVSVTGRQIRPGGPILRERLGSRSPSYQSRIRNSRSFRAEAARNGMDVDDWYRRAPNLSSARGHTETEPRARPGFHTYIAREYTGLGPRRSERRRILAERVKRAHQRQRRK